LRDRKFRRSYGRMPGAAAIGRRFFVSERHSFLESP